MELKKLYQNRFTSQERTGKNRIWRVLCQDFFQSHIGADDTVLDLAAGYCEFINNIMCKRKLAVDLNPDTRFFAGHDVEVIIESCLAMPSINDASVNVVFISNFLEHCKNKEEVLGVLKEVHRVLKKGGSLMILQPNIRFLAANYWDFFDHHTALSDRSLKEALEMIGFSIKQCYPKFLPYTTKSKLPKSLLLLRLYLKLPAIWRVFGRQCFIVAIK